VYKNYCGISENEIVDRLRKCKPQNFDKVDTIYNQINTIKTKEKENGYQGVIKSYNRKDEVVINRLRISYGAQMSSTST